MNETKICINTLGVVVVVVVVVDVEVDVDVDVLVEVDVAGVVDNFSAVDNATEEEAVVNFSDKFGGLGIVELIVEVPVVSVEIPVSVEVLLSENGEVFCPGA